MRISDWSSDVCSSDLPSARLDLVIVGGGATGVELAVELHEAGNTVAAYGLPNFRADRDLAITLVEGAPRILAALPEKISNAALARWEERRVGKECVSKGRSRGAPVPLKKKKIQ